MWPGCAVTGTGTTAGQTDWLLRVPAFPALQSPLLADTTSSSIHREQNLLTWISGVAFIHCWQHTVFACDTPVLSPAASLPSIPFPWSPRSRPKLQVLPHYTNSGHAGAKCKAWFTTHFRMQLEQGWESSLDGYTLAELLPAQVHTRGSEGGEDSTEAWLLGEEHGLGL